MYILYLFLVQFMNIVNHSWRHATNFGHLEVIKFFINLNIKLSSNDLRSICISPSPHTLEIIRYLFEEVHCESPLLKDIEQFKSQIRIDVLKYLKELGVI